MENYLLPHIFLSFGMYLPGQSSCHLYMAFQLLQNMASGRVNVKKETGHVFYMVTPSHATHVRVWGHRKSRKKIEVLEFFIKNGGMYVKHVKYRKLLVSHLL